ncbi:MAG TPA: isoprenyl transferase [Bacillota bacterium]|nr:isoprenyl transferase [Bacillota bacterium]HPJ86252.1 isoprenyl transferase [Bacillota bacterium]HPQ62317.1 isoprenyl transferase [Bacillota bacterium]HRX91899.1 isoprenyl transferase [Candidatus Izemoplasmatales bacterium]
MSKKQDKDTLTIPKHIAIILDGNGRWAKKRHMPRTFGHHAGVENIKRIASAASDLGIKALSVFLFSTENWNRPQEEVDFLMALPREFEAKFGDFFKEKDIKVIFSGRKTKLSDQNREILERIARDTREHKGLVLNICFDYGSYEELTQAVKKIATDVKNGLVEPEQVETKDIEKYLYTKDLPPLDLLIRTSGEVRLSNFMLWQAAYAELYFCDRYWPAFSPADLWKAIVNFNDRDRRYGGLKGQKHENKGN